MPLNYVYSPFKFAFLMGVFPRIKVYLKFNSSFYFLSQGRFIFKNFIQLIREIKWGHIYAALNKVKIELLLKFKRFREKYSDNQKTME